MNRPTQKRGGERALPLKTIGEGKKNIPRMEFSKGKKKVPIKREVNNEKREILTIYGKKRTLLSPKGAHESSSYALYGREGFPPHQGEEYFYFSKERSKLG